MKIDDIYKPLEEKYFACNDSVEFDTGDVRNLESKYKELLISSIDLITFLERYNYDFLSMYFMKYTFKRLTGLSWEELSK